ncbi:hypothetical protein FISHEDRAFT_41306 [Fistulina hepatica ATCC 64428]|nr:hypothetical protein FISHEDRAFT_41306 [Fistulina hepatica ATCC 64428]
MAIDLDSLPVELIAEILGELDLKSLVICSCLSKRLRQITSDASINPWRKPIIRALRSNHYQADLRHLSVRQTVPRQNWVEILSLATPAFILYDATLPNLKDVEWKECFYRRFPPGWRKYMKNEDHWRSAFLKTLQRVYHRSHSTCTVDEAWTKFVVLNRNGTANELEHTSRNFNPLVIFDALKLENNLATFPTQVRVAVEFVDVRVLAMGVLGRPPSTLTVNPNAHDFLHPPGITQASRRPNDYTRLTHPLPVASFANYPFHTPSGMDKRWIDAGGIEDEGLVWIGPLLITAQIVGPHTTDITGVWPPFQEHDLAAGPGRSQYAPFLYSDLFGISPWMVERVTQQIVGPGLGH